MTNRLGRFVLAVFAAQALLSAQVVAIRAGHLIDPDTGSSAANQVMLVDAGKFTAIGANVAIPQGAEVIDLSQYYVSPGLVDAHNHLALTYKRDPENNNYYLTTVLDSTAIRAIQAVSNGITMMSAGFTVVRDLGNNGNYADTAHRVAIDQGWVPGPTMINSGIIIGPMGGQFSPAPERANLVYPEYLDADTPDEIVKAVRKNILFGAKVIKICVDCKSYGYTVDEMKLFVAEAAKSGLKVAGHVQTHAGALRAIEAGIWSIEHSNALDDQAHKLMAQKGIWRVGTETPISEYYSPSQARYDRMLEGMKNAHSNHEKMAFSTDADYYIPGMTRGQVVIDFLRSWKAAKFPAPEILKIMTVNRYRVCDIYDQRGPVKVGLPADLIAMRGNPLDDIDALRTVPFVMKDGVVFKREGVMTPEKFFHSGPVNGWRLR
ncbi:MAG TPA: amidohydrolase family protein [Bryobacteraceae bacterium]|nr:amidohydrolase family protein [Bryobacteraceae bacterium]